MISFLSRQQYLQSVGYHTGVEAAARCETCLNRGANGIPGTERGTMWCVKSYGPSIMVNKKGVCRLWSKK